MADVNLDSVDDLTMGVEYKFLLQLRNSIERDPYTFLASLIEQRLKWPTITIGQIQEKELKESDCWEMYWIIKKANSAEPMSGEMAVEISSPRLLPGQASSVVWSLFSSQ